MGQLNATYEGKVTDSSDPSRTLKTGEVGDIWIRTPGSTRGYWNNPAATEQVMGADGWISTGDVGYVDDEGNWYIVDRKKVTPCTHAAILAGMEGLWLTATTGFDQG